MSEIVVNPEQGALGVYGLEARHSWGELAMNDLTVWPRYKLDDISGLHDLPDSDEAADGGYSRTGEVPRSSFLRGKTVVYSGRVQAETQASLKVARSALISAVASRQVGRMDVTPHPDYADGGQFFHARPISCVCPDKAIKPNAMPTAYQRPFVVSFRLFDPRIYDAEAQLFESSGVSSSIATVEVDNPGSADVDPVLQIYGPITNPTVRNLATNRKLVFQNLTIVSGDFLEIDFARRTILANGVDDFRVKRDALNSDWWDAGEVGLLPGTQTLRLTGSSFTNPAKLTVSFHPAMWG
jgi:hypothetical protein